MTLHFPEFGIPSLSWRHIFAVIVSVGVGCSAVRRLAAPAPAQRSPESSIAITSGCKRRYFCPNRRGEKRYRPNDRFAHNSKLKAELDLRRDLFE
jgi:hypothetical protein